MSSGRGALHAAGGGLTLVGLIYNRLFLWLAGLLLFLLLCLLAKTIWGKKTMKKEENPPKLDL